LRVLQHQRNPAFESTDLAPQVFFWPFNESQRLEAQTLEATLIASIRPKLNRVIPSKELLKDRTADRQAQSASRFATLVAGVASSVAIAITASQLFGLVSDKKPDDSIEARLSKIEATQIEQANVLAGLTVTAQSLQKAIEVGDLKPKSISDSRDLAKLSEDIKNATSKIAALEAALNTDPAKALAVPLLRKDLDNTRDSLKANIDQTKSEIDRIYDQNKWFIGLMFTIALSVLSMAASNLLYRRSPDSIATE
jgi:hypothetical protein